MLAPAPPRPGSIPGPADRRRSSTLVVIALVAGILAVLVPVLLAIRASGDEPSTRTSIVRTGAAAPVSVAAPSPASSAPATTGVASTVAPSEQSVPVADAPATSASPSPTTATGAAGVQPVLAAAGANPVVDPTAGSATAPPPADWMQAMRPQVDPEGLATWVLQARGAWGATDGHTVYIDPNVPADKRWSVMVHEYGHVLQVRHYGSLNATAVAMNAVVGAGATDKGPTESNADCIAELLGATWTDYGCQDALRPAAAALVEEDRSARTLAA